MRLEKKRYDDIVILKFTGEFDTFNLPAFSERIDRMVSGGDVSFVLDLHLLKFINSAALGYLIKTAKSVRERKGEVVIARPSRFLQKTLVTLGLENVFKIFPTVEDAILHFKKGADVTQLNLEGGETDESLTGSVPILFRATGKDEQPPNQVGRIVTLYEDGLLFRYEPTSKGDPVEKMLQPATSLKVKFRQPFAIKDYYFEMDAKVVETSPLIGKAGDDDRVLTVRLRYDRIKDEDKRRLAQFVRDQESWRAELKH
jgi:anti-sigma B factor antagonist